MSADAQADAKAAQAASAPLSQHSVLSDVMPHLARTLRREPAMTFTLGYLLVALAGIFFNYSYYHAFDIPVLTLSQVNDFLVAGVQEPMALLIVLLMFPLVLVFDWFNARARRKRAIKLHQLRLRGGVGRTHRFRLAYLSWRVERTWYLRVMYLGVIVIYGWIFVGAYADYRANEVKRGEALHVRVWLAGEELALPPQAKAWTYLGATFNYILLYDHVSHQTQILPVNNVKRIEPVRRDPATGKLVAPVP